MAKACLEKAVAASSAGQPARALPPGRWLHGTGTALVLYGCNLHHGGQHLDRSSAVVILQADGSAVVRVGLTEMGQGNLVAAQTVAATALGIDPVKVEVWQPDTTTVADSGPTVASRGAHASGLAILEAVRRLRRRLDPVAAELLGCEPSQVMLGGDAARVFGEPEQTIAMEQVVQEMVRRRIETIATGWYRSRRRRFDPATGLGSPYEFYAMACHVARVAVDPDLGLVRVEHVAAAHDVGKVLHRDALEGQIQGGIVQAMGWALTEELKLSRGRLLNPGFTDYLIPTSDDAPAISIALLEDAPGSGPFGSKGIGEPSFIPTAAAIRNAVCDAIGAEVDRLPLTPPVIVEAVAARHPFSFLLP
jgi:CO/xanthine dehydrogenase Mo-binding subunit